MSSHTLERDGASVHYEVHDSSSTVTPLLLTHGFGASTSMWRPNVGALSEQRRVITWDVRGHGATVTTPDPARYTHAACVADMVGILDALGIERAAIAGLSLGGYLSLCFHLEHPERVAALALFDTGPGFKNDDARARWNDYAASTADALERSGADALRTSPEVDARANDPNALALAARGILAQHDASVISSLPSVAVPTLIVVGALDAAFLNAAAYLASRVPDARLCEIADAGHAANIDQPERFNAIVNEFLSERL